MASGQWTNGDDFNSPLSLLLISTDLYQRTPLVYNLIYLYIFAEKLLVILKCEEKSIIYVGLSVSAEKTGYLNI